MKIKVNSKETLSIPGRSGMCCGACCAPLGVN